MIKKTYYDYIGGICSLLNLNVSTIVNLNLMELRYTIFLYLFCRKKTQKTIVRKNVLFYNKNILLSYYHYREFCQKRSKQQQ